LTFFPPSGNYSFLIERFESLLLVIILLFNLMICEDSVAMVTEHYL